MNAQFENMLNRIVPLLGLDQFKPLDYANPIPISNNTIVP